VTSVVLGLGANIGDPQAALRGAVAALDDHPRISVTAVSHIYGTDPVGGPEQPRFCNAVALIETDLPGDQLLDVTQSIEHDWHRTREVRWGPRTLDIDIIAMGDAVSADPRLTLPHPRAHERAFVLVPWMEIQPDAALPGYGAIRDLLAGIDVAGVEQFDELLR
jgi:2-amino-4-hydroxy-6-hydroxymethyldihydropteridine diphosphokinase